MILYMNLLFVLSQYKTVNFQDLLITALCRALFLENPEEL